MLFPFYYYKLRVYFLKFFSNNVGKRITRRCLRLRLRISILWKTISIFPLRYAKALRAKGNIFLIENVPKTTLNAFQREHSSYDTHHLFFRLPKTTLKTNGKLVIDDYRPAFSIKEFLFSICVEKLIEAKCDEKQTKQFILRINEIRFVSPKELSLQLCCRYPETRLQFIFNPFFVSRFH